MMESEFHNFKFLTFAIQLILHVKLWLICAVNYIIYGGKIKSWNYRSGRIELKKNKIILSIIMLVPNNKLQRYKEHVISFIVFAFGEGVTIIDWLENKKIYVSNIEE